MAREHHALVIEDDRVDEPEFANAFGDLPNLGLCVRPLIAWVGLQAGGRRYLKDRRDEPGSCPMQIPE